MRLLLAPLTGGVGLGPLTRCLAVAYEARRREHSVAFVCRQSFAHIVRALGYQAYLAPSPRAPGPRSSPFRLSDVAVELGLTDAHYIHASVQAERQAIQTFQPDMIFTETQLTIAISAAIERIPCSASTSWADHPNFTSPLYTDADTVKGHEDAYNSILSSHSLPTISDVCELGFLRSDIMIAPTIPELQPELASLPGVRYVGSLLSTEMEHGELPSQTKKWDQRRPVIYVYMSPGDIPPEEWMRVIVETFGGQEFNVLVTLSPLDLDTSSALPYDNIAFANNVPGSTASKAADLIITHGGSNTVANALIYGKPSLIFAHQYAERDYNGRSVEKNGAGLNLATEYFSAAHLASLATRLIQDESYAANARRLGQLMLSYGGASATLDAMETYANSRLGP